MITRFGDLVSTKYRTDRGGLEANFSNKMKVHKVNLKVGLLDSCLWLKVSLIFLVVFQIESKQRQRLHQ